MSGLILMVGVGVDCQRVLWHRRRMVWCRVTDTVRCVQYQNDRLLSVETRLDRTKHVSPKMAKEICLIGHAGGKSEEQFVHRQSFLAMAALPSHCTIVFVEPVCNLTAVP